MILKMESYGRLIADIHIKDILGGSSVMLGKGNANIKGALEYFENFQNVPLIMQA